MAKILLTKAELLELDNFLIEAYTLFREIRARSSVGHLVHYPSVPAAFSESLTIHCVEYFFGEKWTAKIGKTSDVILEKLGEYCTVEVKSTGQTNFQELKQKDLAADFLVWMHFGDRYINGSGKLWIYILKNPGEYFKKSLRLKLRDFLRYTEGSINLTFIEVESLQKLLDM
jgi:hypothetical protein